MDDQQQQFISVYVDLIGASLNDAMQKNLVLQAQKKITDMELESTKIKVQELENSIAEVKNEADQKVKSAADSQNGLNTKLTQLQNEHNKRFNDLQLEHNKVKNQLQVLQNENTELKKTGTMVDSYKNEVIKSRDQVVELQNQIVDLQSQIELLTTPKKTTKKKVVAVVETEKTVDTPSLEESNTDQTTRDAGNF